MLSSLPAQIKDIFRGIDLILHAGDIYTLPVLNELELAAPIIAAEGNYNPSEVVNDAQVQLQHILTMECGFAMNTRSCPMSSSSDIPTKLY
ncbi:hypothetical protein ACFLUQ_01105 [Chloroflexota bacterium]